MSRRRRHRRSSGNLPVRSLGARSFAVQPLLALPSVLLLDALCEARGEPVDLDSGLDRDDLGCEVDPDGLDVTFPRIAPSAAAGHSDDDVLALLDRKSANLGGGGHAEAALGRELLLTARRPQPDLKKHAGMSTLDTHRGVPVEMPDRVDDLIGSEDLVLTGHA